MAQHDRRDQRVVGDLHAVEHLEPLAQAAQDRDRVLDRGLVDEHRLEPSLQRGVLLDVLAVLVEGGGADHVQLAAGEHRLEHVAGVHRALGGARPDDGVQLVDEQQDAAAGRLDLGEHRLEALLELAPVLRAGDQRSHVEVEDHLVAQPFGDVTAGDALGEALDDGGLADARVADEHRVVLRLAGQDLDDPPDLRVAPDDGVEPARRGVGDQVTAVLVQGLIGAFGRGRGHSLVAAHRGELLQELVPGQPLPAQQPARTGLGTFFEQGDEEMLDRDVLVLEPPRLPFGRVQQPGQALGDEHLTGRSARSAHPGTALEVRLDVGAEPVRVGSGRGEQARHQAVRLLQQRQQQVLAVGFGVPVPDGLGLGVLQCLL